MPDGTAVDADALVALLDRLAHADLAADLASELQPAEIVDRVLHRVVELVPGAEQAGLRPRSTLVPPVSTGPEAAACLAASDVSSVPHVGAVLDAMVPHDGGLLLFCASAPFPSAAHGILPVVATRVGVALAHAEKLAHLLRAIDSRQTIGQACGILVERHRLRPDEAFSVLRRASQRNHLKLRDLAARVVETGQEPDDIRA